MPLCTQTEPVNLRREEVVQDEHDRFRTALQVELLQESIVALLLTHDKTDGLYKLFKYISPQKIKKLISHVIILFLRQLNFVGDKIEKFIITPSVFFFLFTNLLGRTKKH